MHPEMPYAQSVWVSNASAARVRGHNNSYIPPCPQCPCRLVPTSGEKKRRAVLRNGQKLLGLEGQHTNVCIRILIVLEGRRGRATPQIANFHQTS